MASEVAAEVVSYLMRNNLPAQATPFVGRGAEVADVEALLATSRMVTLTGAGGTGKRRLAVQVAADQLPGHPDGVFVIDLAGLSDRASIVEEPAQDDLGHVWWLRQLR